MAEESNDFSLDLLGLGKVAKSIPKSVYEKVADTTLGTFEKLVAPITETTHGIGVWLRQKFQNMAEYEKALAHLSIYEAIENFKKSSTSASFKPEIIDHPKSFINAIVESSKETNIDLHRMWVNLLANTLETGESHPFFVNVLKSISPIEAALLNSINIKDRIGKHGGVYLSFNPTSGMPFIRKDGDEVESWPETGVILYQFNLINFVASNRENYPAPKDDPHYEPVVPYLTDLGADFHRIVSNKKGKT